MLTFCTLSHLFSTLAHFLKFSGYSFFTADEWIILKLGYLIQDVEHNFVTNLVAHRITIRDNSGIVNSTNCGQVKPMLEIPRKVDNANSSNCLCFKTANYSLGLHTNTPLIHHKLNGDFGK